MIVRQLKGFDKVPDLLPLVTVDSFLGAEGWSFVPYDDKATDGVETAHGTGCNIPGHEQTRRIRELYLTADSVRRPRRPIQRHADGQHAVCRTTTLAAQVSESTLEL